MNFRVGQKVVCVRITCWRGKDTGRIYDGPKKGDIVTIDGPGFGPGFVALKEWEHVDHGNSWDEQDFRPIKEADLTASLAQTESERIVEERPDHVPNAIPA